MKWLHAFIWVCISIMFVLAVGAGVFLFHLIVDWMATWWTSLDSLVIATCILAFAFWPILNLTWLIHQDREDAKKEQDGDGVN